MYNEELKKRCINEAKIMISRNYTIRQVAKIVGLSKTTVHNDLTKRLKEFSSKECRELYGAVSFIISTNKLQRHIRGGIATKKKYLKKRL